MKSKPLVVLSLLLLSVQPVPAQNATGQAGAFLRLGIGARAQSLGGAFTAIANDATAAYWNPAGLTQVHAAEFVASFNKMSLGRSLNSASAALPLGGIGTIGVNWIGFGVTGLEGRTGNTQDPDFVFTSSDNAFLLTYARQITANLSAGVNAKFIQQGLEEAKASGTGFDVAIFFTPVHNIQLGLGLWNLATRVKWSNANAESFPQVVRGGLSARFTRNLLVALDVNKIAGAKPRLQFGVEHQALNLLPLRLGYASGSLALGVGLSAPMQSVHLNLDYAYGKDQLDGSDSHKISLRLSLAPSKSPGAGTDWHKDARDSFDISSAPGGNGRTSTPAEDDFDIQRFVRILPKLLSVRRGPGKHFERMGLVRKGQRFRIIGVSEEWYQLAFKGGKQGWVHRKYVKEVSR